MTAEELRNKYEMFYDLHTHTTYSHGKGSVEDNVREAFNQNMEFIAPSSSGIQLDDKSGVNLVLNLW